MTKLNEIDAALRDECAQAKKKEAVGRCEQRDGKRTAVGRRYVLDTIREANDRRRNV